MSALVVRSHLMTRFNIYDMAGNVVDYEFTEWDAHVTTNALGYHDHYYVEVSND